MARPGGWFSEEQGQWYKQIVQDRGVRNVVEVGCHLGLSMSYLLELPNPPRITAVDIWEDPGVYKSFCSLVRGKNVRVLRMSSMDALEHVTNRSQDLVFIDAAHDYGNVRQDLAGWVRKLRRHGTLAGHDWNWGGVRRAVEEFHKSTGRRLFVPVPNLWLLDPPRPGAVDAPKVSARQLALKRRREQERARLEALPPHHGVPMTPAAGQPVIQGTPQNPNSSYLVTDSGRVVGRRRKLPRAQFQSDVLRTSPAATRM